MKKEQKKKADAIVGKVHKVARIANIVAVVVFVLVLVLTGGFIPDLFMIISLALFLPIFGLLIFANYRIKSSFRFRNIALLVANLIWILATATSIALMIEGDSILNKIADAGCTTDCKATVLDKPIVLYISGEDDYGNVDDKSRSDVNQIAVINPSTHKILLINTPRDYYVELPNFGPLPDKLTHAGNFGINESINALENLYDIEIDNWAKVNFTSLTKLVDILGGITVNSEYDFTTSSGRYHIVKGENKLNSKQALAFSRERYSFDDGDRQRGKNQQLVISAISEKLKVTDAITNYNQMINALSDDFRTNLYGEDMKKIIQAVVRDQYTFESVSVTGAGAMKPTYSYPKQNLYVMIPDEKSVDKAKAKINEYLSD